MRTANQPLGLLLIAAAISILNACQSDPLIFNAPVNLFASDEEYGIKIVLDWDDVPGADGYYIERAGYDEFLMTVTGSYARIADVAVSGFSDYGTVSQTAYSYRVQAYGGSTVGDYSEPAVGKTTALSTEEAFNSLADLTGGVPYEISSSTEVSNTIIEVLQNYLSPGSDFVILIDATGSMTDDIADVKSRAADIIDALPAGTRLGAAYYRDINEDEDWYAFSDLSSDHGEANLFIQGLLTDGGGDTPESVYDGIYNTISMLSWQQTSEKAIVVVGDAPPLEGSFTQYSLQDVVDLATSLDIAVNLYPILVF